MSAIIWTLALSAAFAAALNGTMVMPVTVMALGRIPGIDDSLATVIGSAEIAGVALYCLCLPRLAGQWRHGVAIGGVAALILGESLSHVLNGVLLLTGARLLTGLGEGAIFSLIATQLASLANAERVWGQLNLIGGTTMGCLLFGLSLLPPSEGRGPLFLCLAGFALATAPFIFLVRRPAMLSVATGTSAALGRRHVGLTLLVVLLIYGVQAAQWAVAGYLGDRLHLPTATVGFYLALSSVAGFIGAVVPSLTRNPARRLLGVAIGHAIMIVSVYCFFNIETPTAYLVGQIFVNIGFYMATPFITGLLTENDRDGALLMRTLIVALFGAAAGTAAAGEMLSAFGPVMFSLAAMIVLAFALLCAAAVFRHSGALSRSGLTPSEQAAELPASIAR